MNLQLRSSILAIRIFLLCLGGLFLPSAQARDDGQHLYVTGKVMESDRCASAWLIKRFIDPQAQFLFLDEQELLLIQNGTQFDTPLARFRRTHTMSTFESLTHHHKLDDAKVLFIAKYMHDLEINAWMTVQDDQQRQFYQDMKRIMQEHSDNKEALQDCAAYLDNLSIRRN